MGVMTEPELLSSRQKTAVVMELLRKDRPPQQICERYGLEIRDLAGWVYRFISAGEAALAEDDSTLQ
jgi:hypothetical protein